MVAGCGGSKHSSAASLKNRLIPPSEISGFKLHRSFAWDNSIDFVAQGLPLPESTPPSRGVDVVDKAGFDAAAGEMLEKFHGPQITLIVTKLDSDKDARKLSSFVYAEGLKQPCFATCSEEPGDMPVSEIPGAKGVQQVPARVPPPDAPPPFSAYGVGFTVGPHFYLVTGAGEPGSIEKTFVIDTARRLYRRAT